MSPKQNAGYWRRWSAACAEQGWTRKTVDLEEKRHAVHIAALGYDKSHMKFNNSEVDKVFAAFARLAQPGNLQVQMQAEETISGDAGERKRLFFRIQQVAQPGEAERVCRHKFDTANLNDLSTDQLEMLVVALVNNKRSRLRAENREAATAPAAERPF
jgi:hypothetical protein